MTTLPFIKVPHIFLHIIRMILWLQLFWVYLGHCIFIITKIYICMDLQISTFVLDDRFNRWQSNIRYHHLCHCSLFIFLPNQKQGRQAGTQCPWISIFHYISIKPRDIMWWHCGCDDVNGYRFEICAASADRWLRSRDESKCVPFCIVRHEKN